MISKEIRDLLTRTAEKNAADLKAEIDQIDKNKQAEQKRRADIRQTMRTINQEFQSDKPLQKALSLRIGNHPSTKYYIEQQERDIHISSFIREVAFLTPNGITIYREETPDFYTWKILRKIPEEEYTDFLISGLFPKEAYPNGKALEEQVNKMLQSLASTTPGTLR